MQNKQIRLIALSLLSVVVFALATWLGQTFSTTPGDEWKPPSEYDRQQAYNHVIMSSHKE